MWRRALLGLATAAVLAVPGPARPETGSFRVRDLDPMQAAALEHALAGAVQRLQSQECRQIFSDFQDLSGHPLQRRLDALGVDAPDYLSLILFVDGSGRRSCHGTDTLAVTAPGSRVVYVCGRYFREAQARRPDRAEFVVLHEALHTLGLGENPPDSLAITRRVGERCDQAPASLGIR